MLQEDAVCPRLRAISEQGELLRCLDMCTFAESYCAEWVNLQ